MPQPVRHVPGPLHPQTLLHSLVQQTFAGHPVVSRMGGSSAGKKGILAPWCSCTEVPRGRLFTGWSLYPSPRSVRLPYVLTGNTRAHLTFKDERAPLVTRETMQTGQACRGVPNPALRLTRSELGEAFSHLILAQLTGNARGVRQDGREQHLGRGQGACPGSPQWACGGSTESQTGR